MSVPNQEILYSRIPNEFGKDQSYTKSHNAAEIIALWTLQNGAGFRMYRYLLNKLSYAKNINKPWELSRADCAKWGIKKDSYYGGKKILEDMGYLFYNKDNNVGVFYEFPYNMIIYDDDEAMALGQTLASKDFDHAAARAKIYETEELLQPKLEESTMSAEPTEVPEFSVKNVGFADTVKIIPVPEKPIIRQIRQPLSADPTALSANPTLTVGKSVQKNNYNIYNIEEHSSAPAFAVSSPKISKTITQEQFEEMGLDLTASLIEDNIYKAPTGIYFKVI